MAHEIKLRAVADGDRDFLMAVFASTRADELAALADAPLIETFVSMQFNAQQHGYRMAYPHAESSLILLEDRPVGRMIVDRTAEAIRLVDIALLAEFRARGIGSILLRQLIDEARATKKLLLLSVYRFNPAVRLYERLGFSKVADDGLYIQMQWVAGGSPA